MKNYSILIFLSVIFFSDQLFGQWGTNGNHIYNTNSGNVGIGTSTPLGLLYVSKNTTEPMITIRNLGGYGGAAYSMIDDGSGADWKFKATLSGGFKIRDHANELDVIVIEPNSFANAFYIKNTGSIGIGTSTPDNSALVDMNSTTKGLLPPRMTNEQIHAISSPSDGLFVYCIDCGSDGSGSMAIYNAGAWHSLIMNNCLNQLPAPAEGTHIPLSIQIIWKWNSVTGAAGYKWSTTNDYTDAEDMGASISKTETGLTSNTTYTRYVWAYNACGNSTSVTISSTTTAGGWNCVDSITIYHVADEVAPVTKIVTYGTVINIPGEPYKCWITSNLGADHQATAKDDATEASAGWYWQFNKQQGYKHDGTIRTPNSTWITGINENSNWMPSNDPCSIELGNGWRIPTQSEWTNIDASGSWNDWNDTWNSDLKVHSAGYLESGNGSLSYRGSGGVYRSTTQFDNSLNWNLFLGSNNCNMDIGWKENGFTIRCIKD